MTFNDVFYKNRFLISLKSFTTFRRLYRLERKIWSPAYPRAAVLVLENWKRLRNSVSLLSQFFFCKIYPATYFADIRDLENFRVFESFQKIVEARPVSITGVYLRYAAIGRSCKAQSFGYSIIQFSFSLSILRRRIPFFLFICSLLVLSFVSISVFGAMLISADAIADSNRSLQAETMRLYKRMKYEKTRISRRGEFCSRHQGIWESFVKRSLFLLAV